MAEFKPPSAGELRQILTESKTVAVVGISDKTDRDNHTVPAYLKEHGYRIIPVNPKLDSVLGEKAYPDLKSVPEPVDVVDIFRRSEFVPDIVEDAIAIGAKTVWMQVGVVNEEAAARAQEAGLNAVMDMCMRATHRLLIRE